MSLNSSVLKFQKLKNKLTHLLLKIKNVDLKLKLLDKDLLCIRLQFSRVDILWSNYLSTI